MQSQIKFSHLSAFFLWLCGHSELNFSYLAGGFSAAANGGAAHALQDSLRGWVSSAAIMAAGIDAPRVFMPKVDGLHGGRVGPRSRTRTDPRTGACLLGNSVSPCFTPGTLIATDLGQRPVETLRKGDKVVTRDNGLRRIHWVGSRGFGYQELVTEDKIKPVLVRAGAFGEDCPRRDMVVSPHHRFLVGGTYSPLVYETDEALVSARHLIDNKKIVPANMLGVTYLHILCARHEVILANGVWTESFHPDDTIMKGLGRHQRTEILSLFPEIATQGAARRFPAARKIIDRSTNFDG